MKPQFPSMSFTFTCTVTEYVKMDLLYSVLQTNAVQFMPLLVRAYITGNILLGFYDCVPLFRILRKSQSLMLYYKMKIFGKKKITFPF